MRNLLFLLILLIAACNDQISDSLTSSSTSSSTSTTADEVDGLTLTSSDNSFMSYYLHEVGETDEGCFLEGPFTTASPKTIDCFLEAEEFDLYINGANLDFQADAGQCEYVAFFPYYYYQYEPGATDKVIYEFKCPESCSATGSDDCNSEISALGIFGATAAFATGGTYYGIRTSPTTVTWTRFDPDNRDTNYDRCDYSYTDLDPAGPNCDDGSYERYSITMTTDSNTGACDNTTFDIDTESTTVDCNGRKKACISGPIRQFFSDTEIEENGVIYQVTDTGDTTLDESYAINSPFSDGLRSNMNIANYTNQCGSSGAAPYYDMDTVEDYASDSNLFDGTFQANDSIAVEGGTTPFYTWYCLNRSLEVMGRIRLAIRDWDTEYTNLATATFENEILDTGVDGPGTGTVMDNAAGSEDPPLNSPIEPFEDRRDWDNAPTPFPLPVSSPAATTLDLDDDGAGGNAACSHPTATTTNSNGYFPGQSL
jgi:hypothetical protein